MEEGSKDDGADGLSLSRELLLSDFPSWVSAWEPHDRRPIYEWAGEHVVLPPAYAQPGPFSVDKSRYMIEPFACIQDELIREVTCIAAIQTGKTLIVEIAIPWVIANDPGPIMWTMQTDEDAQEQCKSRFNPLLQACPPIAAILPTDRGMNNITEKYFGSFFLLVNGANLSNLQSKSIRWKFNSELWLPNWRGLMTHARGRVTRFEEVGTSKIVNESQAGTSNDEADTAWLRGTQEVWSVDCGGGHHELTWEVVAPDGTRAGVVWNEDARGRDGTWNIARACETARYKCPLSGIEMDNSDRTRELWNQSGRYLQTNDNTSATVRSFRWNSLVSRDLSLLVEEWLNAQKLASYGVMEAVKDFKNKRLAIVFEDRQREAVDLSMGGYVYADYESGEPWIDETHRIMSIDRQLDHFWYEIRAWTNGAVSRQLSCGRIDTVEELRQLQLGYKVKDRMVCQDAQHDKSAVYIDCVKYGWTPVHGSPTQEWTTTDKATGRRIIRPYSDPQTTQQGRNRLTRFVFSSDRIKDVLAGIMQRENAWQVPDDVSEEYQVQMRSEVKKEVRPGVWRWEKVKSTSQNHLWDCGVMQVLIASMIGLIRVDKEQQDENEAR